MTVRPGWLAESTCPLVEGYDAALLDLDGVVYVGGDAVPGAAAAVAAARAAGMRVAFVTNNASRPVAAVVAHLRRLDIPAEEDEVATAAQAAARLLAEHLEPGAPVLVVGGPGLRESVADAGFAVVRTAGEAPAAVVQGYTSDVTYAELAEATLAVRAGALWVAANLDATLPAPRGQVPGNGALVALVATATGRSPLVAGKPEPPLHAESVERVAGRRPLVVGDRLDTDIAGATRVGCDSLLVLSGVTDVAALHAARPEQRPTYVAPDITGLLRTHPAVSVAGDRATCRGAVAEITPDGVDVRGDAGVDGLDPLRAELALRWGTASES